MAEPFASLPACFGWRSGRTRRGSSGRRRRREFACSWPGRSCCSWRAWRPARRSAGPPAAPAWAWPSVGNVRTLGSQPTRSRFCSSRPPTMWRTSYSLASILARSIGPVSIRRTRLPQILRVRMISMASSLNFGAMMTSAKNPLGPEGLAEAAVRFHDRPGQLDVHGPVHGDDPAEGADDVAFVRLAIGDVDVLVDGAAAGVEVLDDHGGRLVELLDQLEGGVGVEQVVEADLRVARHELAVADARARGCGAACTGPPSGGGSRRSAERVCLVRAMEMRSGNSMPAWALRYLAMAAS